DQAETSLADVSENLWLTGVNLRTLTGKSSFWQNTVYHGFRDQDGEAGQAIPLVANPQSEADLKPRIYQFFKEQLGESGLRSVFTWLPAPGQTLSLGLDVNRKAYDYRLRQEGLDTLYTLDQDDFRPDPDRNYIIRRPQDVNIDFNDEQLYLGSFFQYAFRPLVNLTLNLGMRYEYNQFNEDHYLSPRASLDYLLDDKTRFSLSGGVYYQAPDFSFALANPLNADLKNERAYHLIGGLNRYLRPDLKLTTEVYYKQFEDLIVRPDRTSQQLSNAGEGWAAGVDVVLLKQFVNKFYGQINYSYSQSKRDDRDGEGEYNSDFNQPHIFSILAGYEFSKELSASVKWRYATGRPEDGYIIHADVFNDPGLLRYSKEITGNNSGRLKDFHTLN
ncbi:MAG TPA: TonB-dependent receptor, partial [Calditrichia bacterium]|nr:TonB-dependent receptor [Calditrichia bacterium]